jgi:glycosyltransferase involved in cell wall biosynthesis
VAEGLPLTLLECLAVGLPVLATRWRGVPEAFPNDYPLLIDAQDDKEILPTIAKALAFQDFRGLRRWFLENFTISIHLQRMSAALQPYLTRRDGHSD